MARSWLIIFFEKFSEAPAFYHISSLFLSFLLLALKKRCPGLPLLIRIMAGFNSISGCFKPMQRHPYPPKFSKGHPTPPPGSRLDSYFLLTHVRLTDHVKNPYLDPCKPVNLIWRVMLWITASKKFDEREKMHFTADYSWCLKCVFILESHQIR